MELKKVFDVYNPNCPIKNKKYKIKKLLKNMPIYKLEDIENMINNKNSFPVPIGIIKDNIIECNGIYYAECEIYDKKYDYYYFIDYRIDYDPIKMFINHIEFIVFKGKVQN